jgi:hypothetical protein
VIEIKPQEMLRDLTENYFHDEFKKWQMRWELRIRGRGQLRGRW